MMLECDIKHLLQKNIYERVKVRQSLLHREAAVAHDGCWHEHGRRVKFRVETQSCLIGQGFPCTINNARMRG